MTRRVFEGFSSCGEKCDGMSSAHAEVTGKQKKKKKENSNQLNSLIIYLALFWTSSTQRKTSEKAHAAEILRKSGMICDKGALTEFMLEEVQKSQTNFPIVYNISFGGTPT